MLEEDGDQLSATQSTDDADGGNGIRPMRRKTRKSSRAKHSATSQPRLSGRRRRHTFEPQAENDADFVAAAPDAVARETSTPLIPAVAVYASSPAIANALSPATATTSVPEQRAAAASDGAAAAKLVEPLADPTSIENLEPIEARVDDRAATVAPWTMSVANTNRPRRLMPGIAALAAVVGFCLATVGLGPSAHRASAGGQTPFDRPSDTGASPSPPIRLAVATPLAATEDAVLLSAATAPTVSADPVAPSAADGETLVAVLTRSPDRSERVTARDASVRISSVRSRAVAPKPVISAAVRSEPPKNEPRDDDYASFASREHAPGAYRLRWGTARLHEDPNRDDARVSAWSFPAEASDR